MSTKIDLRIQTSIDLELFEQGIVVRLVRLFTSIRFQTNTEWTEVADAIIDTGSAVSILPYSIWKDSSIRLLSPKDVILRGIVPQKDAILQAKIAEVPCVFLDRHRVSSPLKIKAYILYDDNIPLIIGFEDVLTVTKFICDYKNNIAYLNI